MHLADSPGLYDTRGYTNKEITQLIKSSIITQSNQNISGVILMFDASNTKLYLADIVRGAVEIFGEEILDNVIFAFNKNDKIDSLLRDETIRHSINTLTPIMAKLGYPDYNIRNHMLFIDTKGDFNRYSRELYRRMVDLFDINGINMIDQDKKLQEKIDNYYKMELKNTSNWRNWTDKEYHAENRTRTFTIDVQEKHTYTHCEEECDFLIFGCDDYCTTYTTYKTVPKKVEETYLYEWYVDVNKTELKYTETELRQKAAKRVSKDIENAVYTAKEQRNDKSKQEL